MRFPTGITKSTVIIVCSSDFGWKNGAKKEVETERIDHSVDEEFLESAASVPKQRVAESTIAQHMSALIMILE